MTNGDATTDVAESIVSVLRYHLSDLWVPGLLQLIEDRPDIMRGKKQGEFFDFAPKENTRADRARELWANAVTAFWLGHCWLSKFDRNEMRLDLAGESKVTLVNEHPQIDIKEGTIYLDTRLVNAIAEGLRISRVEIEDTRFERKEGEADPRGVYEEGYDLRNDGLEDEADTHCTVFGIVILKNGVYSITAYCDVDRADLALMALYRFVRDVIADRVKPEEK